ncbi:MAG TPA: TadE family protein [Patescibacteria group bacterium]|nr:TadE family protein [Patescibacteria group bacterium]
MKQEGQSVLEAALVTIVLVPVLLFILQIFFWLVATYTVNHTVRQAASVIQATGNPELARRVIEENMRYLDRDFDVAEAVSLTVTDNFGAAKSNPAWPKNGGEAKWFRDIHDPTRFGIRLDLTYKMPGYLLKLGDRLTQVRSSAWVPFGCQSPDNATPCS